MPKKKITKTQQQPAYTKLPRSPAQETPAMKLRARYNILTDDVARLSRKGIAGAPEFMLRQIGAYKPKPAPKPRKTPKTPPPAPLTDPSQLDGPDRAWRSPFYQQPQDLMYRNYNPNTRKPQDLMYRNYNPNTRNWYDD